MNNHSALTYSRENPPKSVEPRAARRFAGIARPLLTGMLFLSLSIVAHAGWGEPDPDFSNYEVPLYQQMTNRIKDKITARLGEGKNTRDRYFIIPFAYENKGNDPELSHSFMSVIRVLPDDKQTKLVKGIAKRTYKNREFQAFTISWLPHDFSTESNLCVFKGVGARLFPTWNQCATSPGRSFTLEETVKLGVHAGNAVCMWGPYEISKAGFDLGVSRLRLLEGGTIKYRADDRLTRKDRTAINCFHAMAGIYELYPNGGIFGTGFKMWGINGTARVLMEYTDKANFKKLLLEPVDEKKDRYGYVYASTRDARRYNPFERSSAYRK
ncbi:MAG: hypothetical protein V4819_20905 [Verrucomicrobiota bacterium]